MSVEPLTVSFEIAVGDVWVAPTGVAWYVKDILSDHVYFERVDATQEDAKVVARKWRKVEKP